MKQPQYPEKSFIAHRTFVKEGFSSNPADNYMYKVIETIEQGVNFKHISHLFLVFLLTTLSR